VQSSSGQAIESSSGHLETVWLLGIEVPRQRTSINININAVKYNNKTDLKYKKL
jgi:hypothetical protein